MLRACFIYFPAQYKLGTYEDIRSSLAFVMAPVVSKPLKVRFGDARSSERGNPKP